VVASPTSQSRRDVICNRPSHCRQGKKQSKAETFARQTIINELNINHLFGYLNKFVYLCIMFYQKNNQMGFFDGYVERRIRKHTFFKQINTIID
jgi:hypothetical protein